MKISKLKRLTSGKYKIIFDNNDNMITYDDVIIKNNMLYGKEIDRTKLADVYKDTEYYDVYNKLINYILKRKRSVKEVENFMDKFELDEKARKEIINRLKEIGLLNDANFAASYVADRINLSNVGPYKIKKELLIYNISEEMIDIELLKIDKKIIYDKLENLIVKRIKNNTKYSNYILKDKITFELVNNGFDKEMINEVLERQLISEDNVLKKEFNKIYIKLSKKYEGKELEFKLKQKLFQKGFSYEDVEKLIKEI